MPPRSRSAPTSLRSLARELGLSVATVSEALHGSPRVRPATRERILSLAQGRGYLANPLVSAAMTAVRRASQTSFRGTLGLIDVPEREGLDLHPYHKEIVLGAEIRAAQLGFNLELFWTGDPRPGCLPLTRIKRILNARGIEGLIVLPFTHARDFSALDFNRFSAVQMDFCLTAPTLHRILPDHYGSLIAALARLRERGYRRPAFLLNPEKDQRIHHRWSAAFKTHQEGLASEERIPLLLTTACANGVFETWIRRHRPDVLLGHGDLPCQWLENLGFQVPGDLGYLALNLLECGRPLTGLDQTPRLLGRLAVDTVVSLLDRGEKGCAAPTRTIALEATWIEGMSLRPQPGL